MGLEQISRAEEDESKCFLEVCDRVNGLGCRQQARKTLNRKLKVGYLLLSLQLRLPDLGGVSEQFHLEDSGGPFMGSVKLNVLPTPSALVTMILPPCAS